MSLDKLGALLINDAPDGTARALSYLGWHLLQPLPDDSMAFNYL